MTAIACDPPTRVPTKKIKAKIRASDIGKPTNNCGKPSITRVAINTSLKTMIKNVLSIRFFSNAVTTYVFSSKSLNFPTPINRRMDTIAAS